MLPLSGSPELVIVGREVQLGFNYADLIAVEPAGRLAIIEIKLANNAEARRAIVAQILTYAAFLDRMELETLERRVLGKHLERRNFTSLASASASAGAASFDAATFQEAMTDNLREGRFRLVLVLDTVPPELLRLVGYLEGRSDGLVIDLITVSEYVSGGEHLLVPQRLEPERRPADVPEAHLGELAMTSGGDLFLKLTETLPESERALTQRLVTWANGLAAEGVAVVQTARGATQDMLRVYIPGGSCLVVAFRNGQHVSLAGWRTVFEKRAPKAMRALEHGSKPITLTAGGYIPVDEDVLAIIAAGYREAACGEIAEVTAL